jgi:glutamate-1-semialdehyde 2,1-aminomutase
MYQAGTLSGNPLAMTAGLETLRMLSEDADVYARLDAQAAMLCNGMQSILDEYGLPWVTNRVGSMFTLFFTDAPVRNWDDAKRCDTARFGAYFSAMLDRGVYLAPSQFEAAFMSIMHSDEDVARTLEAARESLRP